jgi:hypothetical protein
MMVSLRLKRLPDVWHVRHLTNLELGIVDIGCGENVRWAQVVPWSFATLEVHCIGRHMSSTAQLVLLGK